VVDDWLSFQPQGSGLEKKQSHTSKNDENPTDQAMQEQAQPVEQPWADP
jgi:hypothetical protein